MQKPLHELTVVQANDFIRQTNWVMDKVPLKLFKALIANIDVNHPPKDSTIRVQKTELIKLLDTSGHNYAYLRKRLKQLITAVRVEDTDDEEHYVALVQDIYWKIDTDEIRVKFHENVMPYLVGLKARFLQYPAENINQFKSKYGLILYENLLSRERQYRDGSHYLTIQEIRRLTGTEKLHIKWVNFEKYVLKTAIEDINNAKVEILVDYEKVKRGRTIKEIHFFVRERNSHKETGYIDVQLRRDQLDENY